MRNDYGPSIALKEFDTEPNEVHYTQVHGIETYLGNPIEVDDLSSAFGNSRENIYPFFVGSVKSKFGNLQCAAEMDGLSIAMSVPHQI